MRILMYHEVTDQQPEELHAVSRTAFAAQMRWLHTAGYQTVALADWLQTASSARLRQTGKSIIITFDDGYRDNHTHAWPILAEYGFSATIFLVTGRMGHSSDWRSGSLSRAPLLTWQEARELAATGIRFGSHTVNHADLNAAPPAVAEQELRASRADLQQALGVAVDHLAYPYSRFNAQVKDLARQAGYHTACSCPTGYVGGANHDPYDLRRITILAADQMSDFAAKVRGDWPRKLSWYRRVFGAWRRRQLGARA